MIRDEHIKILKEDNCLKTELISTKKREIKIELYNDHFENAKRYQIPRAQLIIADIPYNIGINAYGSRSDWYVGGDNRMERGIVEGMPVRRLP